MSFCPKPIAYKLTLLVSEQPGHCPVGSDAVHRCSKLKIIFTKVINLVVTIKCTHSRIYCTYSDILTSLWVLASHAPMRCAHPRFIGPLTRNTLRAPFVPPFLFLGSREGKHSPFIWRRNPTKTLGFLLPCFSPWFSVGFLLSPRPMHSHF